MTRFRCFNAALIFLLFANFSCSRHQELKEEQIRADIPETEEQNDSLSNSISGRLAFDQLSTNPNSIILTGLPEHRLVTVYKVKPEAESSLADKLRFSKSNYDYQGDEASYEHFMPGIDILYGYNLLNIGHYNLSTEKLDFLFKRPAFIKTLYYPSFVQDSVDKMPVIRNYLLVSVYDEDTNKDTLINKKDLRHFYHVDLTNNIKTQLIPGDYSVTRSQYDPGNDVMFLFATRDTNKNGMRDKSDSRHVFWFRLKDPKPAKKLY